MRLIPAIDLRGGRCVRLLRGDFAPRRATTPNPAALAREVSRLGAAWLHVVDLDGARDGTAPAIASIIVQLAAQGAAQAAGGRRLARYRRRSSQMLDLGVGRVVIGSAAVTSVDAGARLARALRCGARRRWPSTCASTPAARRASPPMAGSGSRSCLCGAPWRTIGGYAAQARAVHRCRTATARWPDRMSRSTRKPCGAFRKSHWQASGGMRDARDLHALADAGAAAAISGKALLEELIPAEELQPFLPNA